MNDITDIETIITDHFDFIERDFHILPETEFDACYRDYPQARYGWTFPEIGAFCVERIQKQTAHLDDEDLINYMRVVLWIFDRHIVLAYQHPDMTAMERHRAIESELYDIATDSMVLLSQVEMRALES